MKTIFQANNILEAHIVSGLLNSEGIKTYTAGHYLQGAVGELPATDFAFIQVEDKDENAALEIISQYEQDTLNS